MRLHQLSMQAFGPFADTVTVDFDRLSESALFLLCGDTGAGKTTVLDAVCFALYGDVPGRRGTAKQLRSHHAATDVAPRVVLEATVAGRRLRCTRSPAWQRPKKRGAGTTTEQARVLVEERVGEGWELRTNRLDEAGHLVDDLLGMTLAQFSQVVLLPQGEFDTFLRSSSEERQRVLTKLFDTGRFARVEEWFAERRRQLGRDHRGHQGEVAAVLHRLSQCADEPHPAQWDLDDLSAPAVEGQLGAWAGALLERAQVQRVAAARVVEQTDATRREAAEQLSGARRRHELHERRRRAVARRSDLETTAAEADRDRDRLGSARRAATVAPLRAVLDEAAARQDRATGHRTAAVGALAEVLGADAELDEDATLDEQRLEAREQETVQRLAAVRAFLPRAEELRAAEQQHRVAVGTVEETVTALASAEATLGQLPGRRHRLEAELSQVRAEAERAPVLAAEVGRLADRLAAAESASALEVQLVEARAAAEQQRAVAVDDKERWMALRERRLDGMAAELAVAMEAGAGCPVCGSVDHPSPAHPAPGAPTREEEQEALRLVEDAEVTLEAHRDQVRGLEARLASARELAGGEPVAELRGLLLAAERDHEVAVQARDHLLMLTDELAFLDEEAGRVAARAAELGARLAAARARAAELDRTVARLTAELAEILGATADRLEDLIADHERLHKALAAARRALVEESRCAADTRAAAERLQLAALEAGFADACAAQAAHLPEEDLAALEERVRQRDRLAQQVADVLADPEVRALEDQDPPDLEGVREAYEEADAAWSDAVAALEVAERTLGQVRTRREELVRALADWEPARAELARVRSLAELVEGKGPDNTRQMRLSAYVLSARLTQVVAAANERLGRMVDHRYRLEHTADRGAGDRRGGLGLVVRDQWTDELRDPVTLSGGETFVVSLALALGLADVVTAESGATDIDTLFVDEGFGSLDADTLELVMDTLDQLREGGRTVGVVSHVAEMKTRIPTRLEVHKGRTGSTVRLLAGDC